MMGEQENIHRNGYFRKLHDASSNKRLTKHHIHIFKKTIES